MGYYPGIVPQGQTKAISRSSHGQITRKFKQFMTFCTVYCILLKTQTTLVYIYCLISAEHSISSYMLGLVINISRSKGVVGIFCKLFKSSQKKQLNFPWVKVLFIPAYIINGHAG